MPDTVEFIESFFSHAASKYYDPIKAHEYYERTKQLKGRHSIATLKTRKQKEGFAYVQSKVKDAKKAELTRSQISNKAAVAQMRANGAQRRQELSDKIKSIVSEKIAAIPKDMSKEDRKALVAQIRAEGKPEREQLSSDLKGTIETARANYKKARESIMAKYEATLQSEFDAIRSNVR